MLSWPRFPTSARVLFSTVAVAVCGVAAGGALGAEAGIPSSHPPMRLLPQPSARPMGRGPAYFVDARRGEDGNKGTRDSPWKTVNHGLKQLKPGDTLVLRRGTYYENVACTRVGRRDAPITIRSCPGELAVIDGGYREFCESPVTAWESFRAGAKGEFRSSRAYPELAEEADPRTPVVASGAYAGSVRVLGNFGDSMVPLHGYHTPLDLRTDNPFWNLDQKLSTKQGIYCGPGLWLDPETKRIHVRLAHTRLKAFGDDNYRGETDPRKLPLIVGGRGVVLDIQGARHLRFQDIVVRGTRGRTINIANAQDVEFDNVTAYGGCPAMFVTSTVGLRLVHSALRGVSAPWSSRASLKYRGISTYLFIASGDQRQNRDFELAHCEFTDCHDGLIIGTINRLRFHHNLVDNFNDDGLYLTTDGPAGRDIHITQNHVSRCLTAFSFAGQGEGQEGTEVYICRNVIDLRRPIYCYLPKGPDAPQEFNIRGRTCADHGSPIWKPMVIYHNTVITHGPAFRGAYAAGFAGHMRRTNRQVFNNIFVHVQGLPGRNLPSGRDDFQADGNLHWSVADGPTFQGSFFAKFRASRRYEESKAHYPPGWAARDLFADPKLHKLAADWRQQPDCRLREDSPAIDAGVPIPGEWPDPLRAADKGKPDIGAIPFARQ